MLTRLIQRSTRTRFCTDRSRQRQPIWSAQALLSAVRNECSGGPEVPCRSGTTASSASGEQNHTVTGWGSTPLFHGERSPGLQGVSDRSRDQTGCSPKRNPPHVMMAPDADHGPPIVRPRRQRSPQSAMSGFCRAGRPRGAPQRNCGCSPWSDGHPSTKAGGLRARDSSSNEGMSRPIHCRPIRSSSPVPAGAPGTPRCRAVRGSWSGANRWSRGRGAAKGRADKLPQPAQAKTRLPADGGPASCVLRHAEGCHVFQTGRLPMPRTVLATAFTPLHDLPRDGTGGAPVWGRGFFHTAAAEGPAAADRPSRGPVGRGPEVARGSHRGRWLVIPVRSLRASQRIH